MSRKTGKIAYNGKKKVMFTLKQAMKAQRVRSIGILFL
jgi:hypothetical protein